MGFDGRGFDEVAAHPAGYEALLTALDGSDLAAVSRAVARRLAEAGVDFGDHAFVVDPVPRLVAGAEWDRLAAGLAQRTRALNRFLHDAYGDQRAVAAGIVPAEVISGAEGFEPQLRGRLPGGAAPAAIVGYDVVRAPDGEFLVLEDNARTPSGFEYATAAREALAAALPPHRLQPRPIADALAHLLRQTLRAAAPNGREDPFIVLLTDGPENVAYAEHRRAAERIGIPLVTLRQLETDGERLRVRLGDGDVRPVDVVYRRCDEDRLRGDDGAPTAVGEALLPAWLSGNLGLVNAFGNGVADDKLVHGHVEDLIRLYLNEEPLVRSVPTYDLSDPEQRARTLADLRARVVKPRHGHGGAGVVIGAAATAEELDRLADEIRRRPDGYISQPLVALSRHPTAIDGRLAPRHIDLRVFAFCTPDVATLPGGLSRVALDDGELVVNSSQNGGGKDTWVLD